MERPRRFFKTSRALLPFPTKLPRTYVGPAFAFLSFQQALRNFGSTGRADPFIPAISAIEVLGAR